MTPAELAEVLDAGARAAGTFPANSTAHVLRFVLEQMRDAATEQAGRPEHQPLSRQM
jgi:2-keto-3-deoxy-6-phosphogluconate aldolase